MPEQSTVRDPRSLFDIDERLVELMDQVADAAADGQEPPAELIEEINEYIEAFHSKVDRIAGYLRWQEAIASICGAEAERLYARKKSAEVGTGFLSERVHAPDRSETADSEHQALLRRLGASP